MKQTFFAFLLVSLVSVLAATAEAETLLVSDIDDTIKVSHVLGSQAALDNVPHINNVFLGMPELYQKLAQEQGLQFAYVSNGPVQIMQYPHTFFLSYNDFPEGGLFLKERWMEKNHKLNIISKLISERQPTKVILIGDNGEKDAEVYFEIAKKFPQVPMYSFIHQLYSVHAKSEVGQRLRPGQIGYITAVDLAAQLKQLSLLSEANYQDLIQSLVPQIQKEKKGLYFGKLALPAWMNCRDALPLKLDSSHSLMKSYAEKIQERCK
jgi:phosphatidate phosphatase APP1